jgi:ElaB/YqjD/DUF883 family membrane-anchored ribosome-binding protein
MSSYTNAVYREFENLTEDSKALLAATADAAEHKIVEARKRLSAGLENSRRAWAQMQEQAVEAAEAANKAVHEHPYRVVGVAFGVGLALGCLLRLRN